ncbi:hypothetical protein O9K51_00487 [Purpureocillium lavendulum]|uniref:Uncharacterized protein n=1 Tax=Purpureocillium lavendulum TaxID=1247861 RepID=A0AB34G2U8_9HYPO|nr:hypothetical protein O9K51_00487 [Purpureocillium lavendulum]
MNHEQPLLPEAPPGHAVPCTPKWQRSKLFHALKAGRRSIDICIIPDLDISPRIPASRWPGAEQLTRSSGAAVWEPRTAGVQ